MHYSRPLKVSYPLLSNWPVYLLVLMVYGIGILLGYAGTSAMSPEHVPQLQNLLYGFSAQMQDLHINQLPMATLALQHYFLWGIALYLLGLTVICLPFTLIFIFAQGFTLGFTANFLTQNAAPGELLVLLAAWLPQNILLIPALIVGSAMSVAFSVLLIRRFFNSQTKIWPAFVNYTAIMVGIMFLLLLAALTEVYVTPAIAQLVVAVFVR